MGKRFVISVMSKDRPGIIADITTVIYNLGGDLADLDQSVLGGFFSMILMADFEEFMEEQTLLDAFSKIQSENVLQALVKKVGKVSLTQKEGLPRETYVVTAQAVNRKGLVKLLGEFFASRNINVLDLVTTLGGTSYTMIFQVDLGEVPSMETLRLEMDELGRVGGLELVMQHNDIYMATNEVGTALDSFLRKESI
jgi:glycine cleavage system transcriptional repressor